MPEKEISAIVCTDEAASYSFPELKVGMSAEVQKPISRTLIERANKVRAGTPYYNPPQKGDKPLSIDDCFQDKRKITHVTLTQAAKFCGDLNPVHFDPEYASETIFGRTIAHGIILNGIFSYLREQAFAGAVYERLERKIAYTKAVEPGDIITCNLKVKDVRDKGSSIFLEGEGINQNDMSVGMYSANVYGYKKGKNVADIAPNFILDGIYSFLLGMKLPGKGMIYMENRLDILCQFSLRDSLRSFVTITSLDSERRSMELAGESINQHGQTIAKYYGKGMLDRIQG